MIHQGNQLKRVLECKNVKRGHYQPSKLKKVTSYRQKNPSRTIPTMCWFNPLKAPELQFDGWQKQSKMAQHVFWPESKLDWMGLGWIFPGGVRYRAPHSADIVYHGNVWMPWVLSRCGRVHQVCGMLRYAELAQMCSMRSPSTSTLSLYPTQQHNTTTTTAKNMVNCKHALQRYYIVHVTN